MNSLTNKKVMGQILTSESFHKNSETIYKIFVYKQLELDEKARLLFKQIEGFNNPSLIAQVKLASKQYISKGYTNAISYLHTSNLIIQHTKELIDSHLTIEAMRRDFYQLSV